MEKKYKVTLKDLEELSDKTYKDITSSYKTNDTGDVRISKNQLWRLRYFLHRNIIELASRHSK